MPLANTASRQQEVIAERALLQRRRHHKLTQRGLAKRLGWGANRISLVENAETSLDTTELYDLAEALECTADYLMGVSEDFDYPALRQVTETLAQGWDDLRVPDDSLLAMAA